MGAVDRIVIVSDSLDMHRSYTICSNYSEGYPRHVVEGIKTAIESSVAPAIIVEGADAFVKSIESYQGVVLPCFFGPASPNSKSLVPAACEAVGLPYVGADAHTHALCNDKYVSRLYARNLGLATSSAILVRNDSEIHAQRFNRLTYPVVVKPNYGGGSNGIGSECLCTNVEEAMVRSRNLLDYQRVAIVVEEYISGYELQVIFARLADGTILESQVGISIDGEEYFSNLLFGIEAKKKRKHRVDLKCVERISEADMRTMRALFSSFEKADYMRIDCRVDDKGVAKLIELSPDCSLSPASGLFAAFKERGYSYAEMFEQIIAGALR